MKIKLTVNFKKYLSLNLFFNFLRSYYRLIFILFFLAILAFNVYIFYGQVYKTTNQEVEVISQKKLIDQQSLDRVLDRIKLRENNLFDISRKQYSNIFNLR